MIPISLPSGRVVFVTLEESLNDNFLQELMTRDDGYEIDDPFDGLIDRITDPEKEASLPDVPDLTEDEVKKIRKDVGKNKN